MSYVNTALTPDEGDRAYATPNTIPAVYLMDRGSRQQTHVQCDAGTREKATEAAEYFESLAAAATVAAKWCRTRATQ